MQLTKAFFRPLDRAPREPSFRTRKIRKRGCKPMPMNPLARNGQAAGILRSRRKSV
jgi:hypothetical protein